MRTMIESPFVILITGAICLLVAVYLAWNMWRTRFYQRSVALVKCEFALLGVLLLIFIRDICQFTGVEIVWLVTLFQWIYAPVTQLLIAIAVIYLNLHISYKFKNQKMI